MFIRDTGNHLRQFWFLGAGPWEAYDLTADVGGVEVAGDPFVHDANGGVGVFIRDTGKHLRQFWFLGAGPWEAYDLTADVGGVEIRGNVSANVAASVEVYACGEAPAFPQLSWVAGGSEPTRLTTSNSMTVLVDGESALSQVARAIQASQSRIDVLQLDFDAGLITSFSNPNEPPSVPDDDKHEPIERLADLLAAAELRGVEIRILLDAFLNDVGEIAGDLAAAGAVGARVRGVSLPQPERTHAKILVVDNRQAFILGLPFDQLYFDTRRHFVSESRRRADGAPVHCASVELRGSAVADVAELFVQLWNNLDARDHGSADQIDPAPRSTAQSGAVAVQVVRSIPRQEDLIGPGETSVLDSYIRALSNARRFIYMEQQYFTSRDIAQCLRFVLDRNPELQAILLVNERPDIPTYRRWQDIRLYKLLDYPDRPNLGVFCRWELTKPVSVLTPRAIRACYMESKVSVVDDVWATIGTANTDGISLNSFYHPGEGRIPFVGAARSIEINASILDGVGGQAGSGTVGALRKDLWSEHLDLDLADLADAPSDGWLPTWRSIASANVDALNASPASMSGHILPYTRQYFADPADQLRSLGIDPGNLVTEF